MTDLFIDIIDDEKEQQADAKVPWLIAIVDDDESVHQATKLALQTVEIQNRPLHFIHAYSAKEGKALLLDNKDTAVVLLDVVMENDTAGLQLAREIRENRSLDNLQIILRTGQPGYAPEEKIINEYEINDYKTKSELTREKLFTCIATAIRSYNHLVALEESRDGLRNIVDASASLMKERSIGDFANGVLKQIRALFNLSTHGIFCVSQWPHNGPKEFTERDENDYFVVATSEKYKNIYGQNLFESEASEPLDIACKAIKQKRHVVTDEYSAIYLSTPAHWEGVVLMEGQLDLKRVDEELLQVFCLNTALGLENAKYFTHLNKAAYVDELTGLKSRCGLISSFDSVIEKAEINVSLFIVDIDYFHDIIESLGYDFGNKVLLSMTSLLQRFLGDEAVISRLHSDVFGVLVYDQRIQVNEFAKECSRPIIVDGNSMRLGVTLGEADALVGHFDCNIEELLRHAEIALKVGKEHKRGTGQVFEPRFESEQKQRLDMLGDLRNGLLNNELFLVLQPKVNMESNEVVGYEALIRWQHPEKGLIPPNAFIPIAEQSGLYFDIDLYVFSKAIELLKEHKIINKPISVNISANSLHHNDFIDELNKLMKGNEEQLSLIELEITENALIRSDTAISHLNDLKAMSFKLCLDDFGAGYSSLGYLLKLPLDVIKIDRAFINYIADDMGAQHVLRGMVDICNNLNKEIVVEGVETLEQTKVLKQMGVEVAQGFYYFKPITIEEILASAL